MKSNIMSKIIINRQVLEDWIKYIDTFPLYPEDRAKLQSIFQQGEEYNENEAIKFAEWTYTSKTAINYKDNLIFGEINFNKLSQDLYKLYKDARNTEK